MTLALRSNRRAIDWSRVIVLVAGALLCVAIARVARHGYVAAAAAGVTLAIGLVWPWLAVRCLRASGRFVETRCRVGEDVSLDLSVHNRWPLVMPAVQVAAPASLVAVDASMSIAPSDTVSSTRLVARRRGVVELAQLGIATSFPFGLFTARRSLRGSSRLIVWPAAKEVEQSILNGASRLTLAFASDAAFSNDGDIAGVRPYRRGDAMRAIHWQQTARHDRLVVRERASGERRGCVVCLDLRRSSYENDDAFERAVSLVAGVVEQGQRDGICVELRLPAAVIIIDSEAGRIAALDALAAVERSDQTAAGQAMTGLIVTTQRGFLTLAGSGRTLLSVDPMEAGQ